MNQFVRKRNVRNLLSQSFHHGHFSFSLPPTRHTEQSHVLNHAHQTGKTGGGTRKLRTEQTELKIPIGLTLRSRPLFSFLHHCSGIYRGIVTRPPYF